MAVQLSHPQGVYECGFCSFTSPDHRVLVKHLVNHPVFKEKKHEHILWCGLCKPSLTDASHIDGHQQAVTNEDHLNGSVHHDNNDLVYGDESNYYSGYNGLYNPYFFPNAYYYPMNIPYRNPCYGNVNGYYQTHNKIFYANDFYGGNFPTSNTPQFIEPAPENKYVVDASYSSENIQDSDSCSKRSLKDMTLPDFELNSNNSNSFNYNSNNETFPVDPQNFHENPPNKSRYNESSIVRTATFSTSKANEYFNVALPNEFGTISNIEPQSEVNRNSIQPTSETLSRKLNGSQEQLSSKEISDPKLNTVKQNPFQTNVREANDSTTILKDLTGSNLEFLSEAGSSGVSTNVVDAKSVIKIKSVSTKANSQAISAPSDKSCYSKLASLKKSEPSENNVNANSAQELTPVSFSKATHVEKIVINASDVKNCSVDVKVDTLSKNAFRKESTSQLCTSEREASFENFLGKGSISAQDMNVVSISDETSPNVCTNDLTEDTLDFDTGSIDVNGPLTKIDLNEIHSEHPTGKLEASPKIQNSISVSSEKDSLVSSELSPKIVMIVRENSVSDIEIQSIGIRDQRTKKDKALGIGEGRILKFEKDTKRMRLKIGTSEDSSNRNSHRESKDNSTEAVTESSKKSQSDKTGDLSNVVYSLRNSYRSDFNHTNKNYGYVHSNQVRLTYCEVLKRGLPLKSSS